MKVPFLDLKSQYKKIKPEVDGKIQEVIDNTAFVMGRYLQDFEKSFGIYHDLDHVIGTNSGTSALIAALMAIKNMKVREWGNENWQVITTSNTFIATVEAIVLSGWEPVFVDINEDTYNMDIESLRHSITDKTKVILPVHLYGQPAHMEEIIKIANEYDLIILEDCAQAHGAEYLSKNEWRKVGGCGLASGFSFYPGKNLGAFGDGGAVGTNDDEFAQFVKMFRDHGSRIKYEHEFIGTTDRLDAIQAAVLNIKLNYIDEWNQNRRENALLHHRCQIGLNRSGIYM
jgi:dTDP-4-amino-4,6-dideoxygalactose transaminase